MIDLLGWALNTPSSRSAIRSALERCMEFLFTLHDLILNFVLPTYSTLMDILLNLYNAMQDLCSMILDSIGTI